MTNQVPESAVNSQGIRMKWIGTIIAITLIIWILYSASQTWKPKTTNNAMAGMNPSAQATVTIPEDMPGMTK
jgi:hypothetical protein